MLRRALLGLAAPLAPGRCPRKRSRPATPPTPPSSNYSTGAAFEVAPTRYRVHLAYHTAGTFGVSRRAAAWLARQCAPGRVCGRASRCRRRPRRRTAAGRAASSSSRAGRIRLVGAHGQRASRRRRAARKVGFDAGDMGPRQSRPDGRAYSSMKPRPSVLTSFAAAPPSRFRRQPPQLGPPTPSPTMRGAVRRHRPQAARSATAAPVHAGRRGPAGESPACRRGRCRTQLLVAPHVCLIRH